MGKIIAAILGAIIGGFAAAIAVLLWFGWGKFGQGQAGHIDPIRAGYVDLLLTVATTFLGAVGVTVTVGGIVIGVIALKTLSEIKREAIGNAKGAAEDAVEDAVAHKIDEMAQKGELDKPIERAATRISVGKPELSTDAADD